MKYCSCVISAGSLFALPNNFKQVIFLPCSRWENWGSESVGNYQTVYSRCCQPFADVEALTILVHKLLYAFTPNPQHLGLFAACRLWEHLENWVSRSLYPPGLALHPQWRADLDNLKHCLQWGLRQILPPSTPPWDNTWYCPLVFCFFFFSPSLSCFPTPLSASPWNVSNNSLSFESLSQHLASGEINSSPTPKKSHNS